MEFDESLESSRVTALRSLPSQSPPASARFRKKQNQFLKKSIKILASKKGEKIHTFSMLIKALKISSKTFRLYGLNKMPEIKELLQKHRHENIQKSTQKNEVKKREKKKVQIPKKNKAKNTSKKEVQSTQKIDEGKRENCTDNSESELRLEGFAKAKTVMPLHASFQERIRSYEEIKAKLFIYKAWKQKNYEKVSPESRKIIDRQIGILEWVLYQDKKI